MPKQITIPRLGWSMEEGVFAEWLKSPGEHVVAGEMLFVLEGEKASQEIESFDAGVLCIPPDAPKPGATVKVGQVIGFLLDQGESAVESVGPNVGVHVETNASAATLKQATSRPTASVVSSSTERQTATLADSSVPRVAGPAARRLARELGIDLSVVATPDPTGRVLCGDIQRTSSDFANRLPSSDRSLNPIATPRVRRLARKQGIDWTQLTGTGRGGRIRERDLIAARSLSPQAVVEQLPHVPGRLTPASKLRRIIAERMAVAVHQAAPVTLTTKVDAHKLISLRNRLKSEASEDTIVPSYNDILIFHVAKTLRELSELNACWLPDGIYTFDEIHIATAIDTPAGLLAPIVRNADSLSMAEIAEQTKQLIQLARGGQLKQEQLTGGTFSVTNLGMFGIEAFTPILNLPQAAILGIGRIVEEPVVRSGRLEVGQTLTLSLTFDHRVLDGAPAARWLQRLCEKIVAG
jgi:pyruvate dehydrogenase E2 component (dihydrolipoamide acetyltransferase)